jgi:hypothetical protein
MLVATNVSSQLKRVIGVGRHECVEPVEDD